MISEMIGASIVRLPEPSGARFGNALLDAMPPSERRWIVPEIRRVFLRREQRLVEPGQRQQTLLFPIDALAWSWEPDSELGRPVPIAFIGRRGAIGGRSALDTPESDLRVGTLSPGMAWRLPVSAFERECTSPHAPLRRLFLRLAYVQMIVAALERHCVTEHNVDQRLACRMLTLFDDAARSELTITHQRLAELVSIRRPSVSRVLAEFARDGLVASHHGQLALTSRDALFARSCACYAAIRDRLASVAEAAR